MIIHILKPRLVMVIISSPENPISTEFCAIFFISLFVEFQRQMSGCDGDMTFMMYMIYNSGEPNTGHT